MEVALGLISALALALSGLGRPIQPTLAPYSVHRSSGDEPGYDESASACFRVAIGPSIRSVDRGTRLLLALLRTATGGNLTTSS